MKMQSRSNRRHGTSGYLLRPPIAVLSRESMLIQTRPKHDLRKLEKLATATSDVGAHIAIQRVVELKWPHSSLL